VCAELLQKSVSVPRCRYSLLSIVHFLICSPQVFPLQCGPVNDVSFEHSAGSRHSRLLLTLENRPQPALVRSGIGRNTRSVWKCRLVGHDRYSVCGAVDEMSLDKCSFTQSIETHLDTRMARSFQDTRNERSGMVRCKVKHTTCMKGLMRRLKSHAISMTVMRHNKESLVQGYH
jgi:hypothetical protein